MELHHERPDGADTRSVCAAMISSGGCRIVHVADAFDAITSARAYRPARDTETAIAELERHSGTDFDPVALDALLAILPFADSRARARS